ASRASFRRVHAIATGSSVLPSGGQLIGDPSATTGPTSATTGPTLLANAGTVVNTGPGAAPGTATATSAVKAVSMVAGTPAPSKSSPVALLVALGAVLTIGGAAAAWVTFQERSAAEDAAAVAPEPSVPAELTESPAASGSALADEPAATTTSEPGGATNSP